MLKLWKPATRSHEDLFIERYKRLFAWCLKLTAHDRQLAEDLLHDAFVQFTLHRPDLNAVQDLDGYLYAMLRNSHVSHLRRALNVRSTSLSMVEFDSLEIGLRVTDVQDQIKVQDELRLICQYATLRKQSSKAGSVLILRFFHGYYPSEMALILNSNWLAVAKWLQLARNEAVLHLQDQQALGFINDTSTRSKAQLGFARTTEELLLELRQMIFSARQGECLTQSRWRELYQAADGRAIDSAMLAHVVSCPNCLDHVNRLFGLPLLSERFPTDMAGRDTKPKGGSGGGPAPPTAGEGDAISRSQRRVKETFEHRPKELRIAVNGHVQVSQKVSSDHMEQTLSLDLEEKLGFVEIFSEQWIRLFFLNVETPPDGAFEQLSRVALSEGRSLEAGLDFSGPCPHLRVVYQDPSLIALSAAENVIYEAGPATQRETINAAPSRKIVEHLWRALRGWDFWIKPSTVTGLVALALIVAVLFFGLRRTPPANVSALGLLDQSAAAEKKAATRPDQVLHRTIGFEERSSAGALIAQGKLEVWHSAEKGITARRRYDDHGALVAGDWRKADGLETIYHHGARPEVKRVSTSANNLDFSTAWQFGPSAEEFRSLIDDADRARVDEQTPSYVISWSRGAEDASGLIKAKLALSRVDLRAIEATLTVRQGNEQRDYRFVELSYEWRPPTAVAPQVFEPEPELLGETGTRRRGDAMTTSAPLTLPVTPAPVLATADLEVEVLDLLRQAHADFGEQISVARTSEGLLKISGVVETDKRKGEILSALRPVTSNPAVVIQVSTVAEALAKKGRDVKKGASPETLEGVEVNNTTPADADLRRRFGSEEQMRRYAARVTGLSRQALLHAAKLKQLANRFSREELRTLSPEARAKWLGLIHEHAAAVENESGRLEQELTSVFPPATQGAGPELQISDDAALAFAAERLFQSASIVDEAISAGFNASTDASQIQRVKSVEFWRALKNAEALAASINRAR